MTKQELRKIYLQKRLSLSKAEIDDLSQKLSHTFFKYVDLSKVKTLHTFLPLEKKAEPNTWLIIHELKKKYPEIQISIPRINADGILESYYLENADQLEISSWGIPEPRNSKLTLATSVDLVIVPLLAYDQQGQRVGYGKGHYDLFLKSCRTDCKKIGISFFEPEVKIDDTFEGDEPLDQVITPKGVHTFNL